MNYLDYASILEANSENYQHRQHIVEYYNLTKLMIEQLVPPMVDQQIEQYFTKRENDKMKNTIQDMIKKQTKEQAVNVKAYFNGKPATNANIVKGVREIVEKALKSAFRSR